jgi:hypothetical protein
MASTIKLKNGSGAPTTGDLVQGEPALDLTNKRLYTENASGVVIEVGTNPSTIDINAGTIDGTVIGGSTPAAVTTTALVATTADINAGTIDGTVIGGSTAAAGTFTTGQFNTSLNVDGTVTADGLTVDGSIATIQNTSDGTALRLSSTQNSAHSLTTPFGEVQFYSGDTSSPGAGVRASIGGYPFDTAASGGGVIKLQTSDSASLKTRLDISNNGDISFYEDTGTTAKFFWDASAESLGIGTSSPNAVADLHVADTSDARIWLDATSADTMELYSGTGVGMFNRSNSYLMLGTNNTERMRIDSSGNVQQATSVNGDLYHHIYNANTGTSAEATLYVSNGSVVSGLFAGATGTNFTTAGGFVQDGAHIGSGSASAGGLSIITRASAPIRFYTNGHTNERMRLDSAGNLLVGKTSADNTTAGTRIHPAGYASFTIANDYPIIANRLSSDGNIAVFRKDGADVGSIGCLGAAIHLASGTTGIRVISDNTIRPSDGSGALKDNAIDLGAANARFKDLYLSGGVYLGGTGAANTLDDYEEGTFTPTYTTSGTDFSSITYDIQEGYYTKVGNMVNVRGFIRTDSITVGSASGDVRISNLPFSAQNNRSCAQLFSFAFAGDHPNAGQVSLTNIGLVYQTSANGTNDNNLAVADMGIGANDNGIIFSLSYQVA